MALAIALGVTASSFWVGALAFIGVLLALVNIGAVGNTEEANAGFYILHILSIAAIACAAWLAGLQPLWMCDRPDGIHLTAPGFRQRLRL